MKCFQFFFVFSEPVTTIHGSPDLYIDTGSTVNLTCIVRHLPEPPATIQWTHNNEVNFFYQTKMSAMFECDFVALFAENKFQFNDV